LNKHYWFLSLKKHQSPRLVLFNFVYTDHKNTMQQKKIKVPKTARYFVLGELTEKVTTVWFVCHGYGQLANHFIRNFEVLEAKDTLIVAPEGLHRFYWEKFSGRVVASWMTKEDREDDILDYVNYLDLLYKEVLSSLKNKKIKIIVLGFSQGTATVCRWIANRQSPVDQLILWAGSIPPDLYFPEELAKTMKLHFVAGDADEFIKEEQVNEYRQLFTEKNLSVEIVRFRGRHEIHEPTLTALAARLC
jgi:predicted esterase